MPFLLKLIIPIDLKTTGKKEHAFYHSFVDWNYFMQSNLYWYILRQNLDADPIFKDYKLANYRFIAINRYSQKPLIWRYDDCKIADDIYYGKNKQFYCKNWRNIIPELNYYLKQKPEFPIGIKQINSIINWLNNE